MSNKQSDRSKILGGMAWKFAERISSQGVSLILSIILARILSPSEYGTVAMMNIFVVFANVFVVAGFNTSLIQKKDADELDFSTVFYCTLVMSLLMYSILFLTAPLIAKYYNLPEMTILTRVFSLCLIIQSYQTVQQAYVSRHMMFRMNFYATLASTILSGAVGLWMAYSGYGVWALVAQHLSSIFFGTIVLAFFVKWHPRLMFSWERAKSLMNYGSKIMGSTLINTIYKEIRQLLIGLYYTPADLALYNRGMQLPNIVTTNLDNTIRSVLFPAMSNYSDNKVKVKQMLRRAIMNSSYITYFCLTLMAVTAKPLIHILLTDKWIDCVPYMQILCVSFMIQTVSVSNIQALKAIGESGEVLKLEFFKKPVFLIVVLAAMPFGVKAIAMTAPLNAIYALWTNMGPTSRHFDYSKKDQLKDLIPGILLAAGMAVLTWPISLLPWNAVVIMILQTVVAMGSYVVLSIVFKVEAYGYCKDIAMGLINKVLKKK